MGAALVGLIGVAVGALLSGLATFSMARRAERKQARAAARLLEAELRHIMNRLGVLTSELAAAGSEGRGSPTSARFADLRNLLNVLKPQLWDEHRATLAAALPSDDWYAVATAYESIDALRGAAAAAGLFLDDGHIAHSAIGQLLANLANDARVGADAVARLAGSRQPAARGPTLGDQLLIVLRDESKQTTDK